MSEDTKNRFLASLGVPVETRGMPGSLCAQSAPDLLGVRLRLSAHYDHHSIQAIFESTHASTSASEWAPAWAWRVAISAEGALRLELGGVHRNGTPLRASSSLASIESAKALFRSAVQQMGLPLSWTSTLSSLPSTATIPSQPLLPSTWSAATVMAFKQLTLARQPAQRRSRSTAQARTPRTQPAESSSSVGLAPAQSDWIGHPSECSSLPVSSAPLLSPTSLNDSRPKARAPQSSRS